ncbi:MAG: helix-turn-helix domain-containing protein [Rhodococcus sp. (in: high G+C Gram-positive bacteria)]
MAQSAERGAARAKPVRVRLDATERDLVQRAWSVLIPDANTIADSITLALIEQDPDYLIAGTSETASIIRRSTREHIRLGLRKLSGTQPSSEDNTEIWRRTGRERARQGVPMELVLKAYTLGSRTLWEELVSACATDPSLLEPRLLLVAGQRLWRALDSQNTILVDAYRRETVRMQQHDLTKVLSALDGLRDGRGGDPAFVADARVTLGVSASHLIACVAGPLSQLGDPPLASPEEAVDGVTSLSYWHIRDGVQFGIISPLHADLRSVADALAARAVGPVGIAPSADGLVTFAAAYRAAARTAATIRDGDRPAAVATDRLPRIVMAADDETSDLVVSHALGALATHPAAQKDTLLRTLAHVLATDGSPTNAAKLLYCHRNTVIYRIRQIEELTGRSTTAPDDRLLLTLALVRSGHWADAVAGVRSADADEQLRGSAESVP